MRVWRVVASAVLVFGLQACAAVTEPLGLEDPFAIPKPFENTLRNEVILNPVFGTETVIVERPQGMPVDKAGLLRDRVIRDLQDLDVPALSDTTLPSWVLKGRASRFSATDSGSVQTIVLWRLFDTEKKQRGQFTVLLDDSGPGPVSQTQVKLFGKNTAAGYQRVLGQSGTPADSNAATALKSMWIGSIKGAPGDGKSALNRALQLSLPLKGFAIEPDVKKALLRIECQVSLAPHTARDDRLRLKWIVLDQAGREVGTLNQENAIPKGRLNQSWGEIAGFAAEAAVEGIVELLQQVRIPPAK